MKKIYLVILSFMFIFLLVGCGTNTPKVKTEEFLSRYVSLNDDVVSSMETSISGEGLTTTNQTKYRDVLKRQYENLKYEVKNEKIDGDKATVTARITVYDLYKSEQSSLDYLNNNRTEFYTNEVLNQDAYDTYRLDEMLKTIETVEYDIDIYLTKDNGTWVVQNPDNTTLEKIHGLYDYES